MRKTVLFANYIILYGVLTYGLKISFQKYSVRRCSDTDKPFLSLVRQSLDQCAKECVSRPHCHALKYRRRFQLCELLETTENASADGNVDKTQDCLLLDKNHIRVLEQPHTCSKCAPGETCDEDGTCSTKANKTQNLSVLLGVAMDNLSIQAYEPGQIKDVHNFKFEPSVKTRYVKLMLNATVEVPLHLCEVQVFESVTCDESFGWFVFERSCYLISTKNRDWEGAREYCKSEGWNLVKIESEQEDNFIRQNILEPDRNISTAWIGLRYESTCKEFRWVADNSTLEYSQEMQWDAEGCVEYEKKWAADKFTVSWNVRKECSPSQFFVCEHNTTNW